MSTVFLAAPSAPAHGGTLLQRLNGPLHQRALWAFMAVVLLHWAEHLFQAWQIWVMGMPRHGALGALGMLWPWLVHSEWLHYGYALVMLGGLLVLWPGMAGRARTWWGVALALQFWHHVEHALLLSQVLGDWRLAGGAGPSSIVQLVIPRVELHLFYNSVVFVPMVVGMAYHLWPSPSEAARMTCSCARHQPRPAHAALASGILLALALGAAPLAGEGTLARADREGNRSRDAANSAGMTGRCGARAHISLRRATSRVPASAPDHEAASSVGG